MNCHFSVKGLLKESVTNYRYLWNDDLDLVLRKYRFEREENTQELRILIPYCDEIIFSLFQRGQHLEFIYYGDNLQHLSGILEIFWLIEPYFEELQLKESLGLWKKIGFKQKRKLFPSICESVNSKGIPWEKQWKDDESELIGFVEIDGQVADFMNQEFSLYASQFSSFGKEFQDVEIRFTGVVDYVLKREKNFWKNHWTSQQQQNVVCEDLGVYSLGNEFHQESKCLKKEVSVFWKKFSEMEEMFACSFHLNGKVFGWVIFEEVSVYFSENDRKLQFVNGVWQESIDELLE